MDKIELKLLQLGLSSIRSNIQTLNSLVTIIGTEEGALLTKGIIHLQEAVDKTIDASIVYQRKEGLV